MNTVKIKTQKPKMIAHRGLSAIEKENTNAAFLAAANRSYFGIETDVHVTKDGKFVIIHDETLSRVSLGKYDINVETSDWSEFSDIILPDTDKTTERRDIRIPLLEEYIKICKRYDKICVLEVKNHFKEDDLNRLVEKITELGYIENVIFISFDLENCLNLRKILPDNEIQWLRDTLRCLKGEIARGITEEDIIRTMCENRLNADLCYERLSVEDVQKLHSNGIKVNCWTCDNIPDCEKMIEYGVDFITTDILE